MSIKTIKATWAAVVICIIALAPGAARAQLVAEYLAEGNANDTTGNHNGTLVNGAGFGAGIFGQAFQLNGTNQYVSVPDSSAFAFGTNPYTLSVRANFDSIRSGGLGSLPNVLVAQDEGGGTTNKWVFFLDGSGNLAFHVNGPSSVFLSEPTAVTPVAGAWHLYSLTHSGTTFTFYEDATSLGSVSNAISVPNAAAPMTIGQAEGLGFFTGRLDDVRIYSSALSASQIAALAAASTPEPGAVALLAAGTAVGLATLRRRIRRTA